MGFPVSNPTYLFQSTSGYIFRLRIPNDLRAIVSKSEFRYSLRTGILRVAKHRARCIASYIHKLFLKVRSSMSEFSTERIEQLVREYIRQTLEDDEKCRALGKHTMDELYVTGGSSMGQKEAESLDISVKRWLKDQDHSLLHPVANRLLTKHGLEVSPDSEEYKTLSRDLMVAFQSILKVRIKRSQGDYSVSDEELIPALKQQGNHPGQGSSVVPTKQPSIINFSEVQERYILEVEKGENWTEKTKAENLSIFALFVRVKGDLPIDQVDTRPNHWQENWSILILISLPEYIARCVCVSSMRARASITTRLSSTSSVPRNATIKPGSMPTGSRWLPMCVKGIFARRDSWLDSRISFPAHPSMLSRHFWNRQKLVG